MLMIVQAAAAATTARYQAVDTSRRTRSMKRTAIGVPGSYSAFRVEQCESTMESGRGLIRSRPMKHHMTVKALILAGAVALGGLTALGQSPGPQPAPMPP